MKSIKEPKKLSHTEHLTIDVVCGMDIVAERSKYTVHYHGVVYYFCSPHCRQHFENNPERYVWEK